MPTLNYDQFFGYEAGTLTVLGLVAIQSTGRSPANWKWACECKCGRVVVRQAQTIINARNNPTCRECKSPYGTKVRSYTYQTR